ncbi:MAG: hypothetical protein LKK13_00540 [Bacilli bacterium]|jgi:hypothetical protein|nr:hypothetical protein [Bacilli bacterium]
MRQGARPAEAKSLLIPLSRSKFYANYYYEGKRVGGIVVGRIKRGKSPLRDWNPILKILAIVLSEKLIFPFFIGWIVTYFSSRKVVLTLKEKMGEMSFCAMAAEVI